MSHLSLALVAGLAAILSASRHDTLADLEHEQARLFDLVAPAVVAITNGAASEPAELVAEPPALVFGPADPRPAASHEAAPAWPERKRPARAVAARRSPVVAATRLETSHGPGPHPEEIAMTAAAGTVHREDRVWGVAAAIVGVAFAGIVVATALARRRFRPRVVPGEGVVDGLKGRGARLRVVRGSHR